MAAGVGATVSTLSRVLGRGGGSVIGGRALLAVAPDALSHLGRGRPVAVVSGTNGKTTTTTLLSAGLATVGPVVSNVLGANLPPGIAVALATGDPAAPAALEVDEAWLGRVVAAIEPQVAVLLNLTRDQLDRNNEVRGLAGSWRATFEGRPTTTVVANADDPLVVWGAGAATHVLWVAAGQPWTADASGCPRCGARIVFVPDVLDVPDVPDGQVRRDGPEGPGALGDGLDASVGAAVDADAGAGARPPQGPPGEAAGPRRADQRVAGVGWACSSCDLRRPPLDVTVADGRITSRHGWAVDVAMTLPGRCNQANAALALTAAILMGADPRAATDAMAATTEVVGRYRTVAVGDVDARLLLSKNPAGWLEVLDMLAPAPSPVVVAINSRTADGRDPSWLWDVPFELLSGRRVVATGDRSRDLAVRLHYAEVDQVRVADPVEAVRTATRPAAAAGAGPDGPARPGFRPGVDVVANYTAFQDLRTRLGAV